MLRKDKPPFLNIRTARSGRFPEYDVPAKRRKGVEVDEKQHVLKSADHVWLVGHPIERITGSSLPTRKQAYLRFRYLKQKAGDPKAATFRFQQEDPRFKKLKFLQILAMKVIDEIKEFWIKGNYPMKDIDKCRKEILGIHDSWAALAKSKSDVNVGEKRQMARDAFISKLDDVLDLNPVDWEKQVLTSRGKDAAEEDIRYMRAILRREKTGGMGPLDNVHLKTVLKINARRESEAKRRETENARKEQLVTSRVSSPLIPSDTYRESDESPDDDEDFSPPRTRKPETVSLELPRNFIRSPILTSTADRTRVSNTQLGLIAGALLKIAGAKENEVLLSHETIRRHRDKNRESAAADIKAEFTSASHDASLPLALHWDEKLMRMVSGDKMEQLAILVSGESCPEGKLLGALPIQDGTGLSMAQKMVQVLTDWDLTTFVTSLVFDTTSANTGKFQGAATRMEVLMHRKMFWSGCRHHICELLLGSSWCALFGDSQSPDNEFFKGLQQQWNTLDKSAPVILPDIMDKFLLGKRTKVVTFLSELLVVRNSKGLIPRDDYRESIKLALVMLGNLDLATYNWLRPGAYHKARWMAHLLYAPKMYAFADQLGYNEEFVEKLRKFITFTSLIYVPYWMKASQGIDAAVNDLQLSKDLFHLCTEVDYTDIANAALKTLQRHTWYLSQEMVVFSLFSSKLPSEDKMKMVENLMSFSTENELLLGKPQLPRITEKTTLPDLVGENSWFLFQVIRAGIAWLANSPELWETDPDFNKFRNFVLHLKVVNDLAERGVKICQDFINVLSKNEDTRQNILQVS